MHNAHCTDNVLFDQVECDVDTVQFFNFSKISLPEVFGRTKLHKNYLEIYLFFYLIKLSRF